MVDTLVEAGHPVVPIHPNVIKACRPRYRAAGGKSDPEDAYIISDVLRTDGHRFRTLRPASDEVKALRALVRSRDALVDERVAVANQLRALLDSFWPGAAAIFCTIDSAISLHQREAATIPMPYASWPGPGSVCCGGAGEMESPTTWPSTVRRSRFATQTEPKVSSYHVQRGVWGRRQPPKHELPTLPAARPWTNLHALQAGKRPLLSRPAPTPRRPPATAAGRSGCTTGFGSRGGRQRAEG